MPYDGLVTRTDAQALVPEEVSRIMLGKAVENSAVLQLFRHIPVSRNQVRFPILSALPIAYFVSGDTGLKQVTELAWSNRFLNIEEIATILPIPENVAADVEANVWDEAEPYLREAFARTLDNAVFFGVNKPSSWPADVVSAAVAAGNTVVSGTATDADGAYMGDLDNLISTLEEDGYDASGFVAARSARKFLRAARDTTGQRLDAGRINGDLTSLDGVPIAYPTRGMWPIGGGAGTNAELIAGDFANEFVVGVRQDITLKMLDQAVIQNSAGEIVYNLAQQDMIAARLVFRVGVQVANTINNDRPTESERYPAAVMRR